MVARILMCTKDAGKSWVRVIEFDGTRHEVRRASSTDRSSNTLYISITHFNREGGPHRHRVYKLESNVDKATH